MIDRRYDKIGIGVVTGTLLPLVSFCVLFLIIDGLSQMGILKGEEISSLFRLRTLSLVSICANVILVRYFQKRYAFQAVRGVVFPTFVYIIGWMIYFSNFLLS